jgi:hypothetical protein
LHVEYTPKQMKPRRERSSTCSWVPARRARAARAQRACHGGGSVDKHQDNPDDKDGFDPNKTARSILRLSYEFAYFWSEISEARANQACFRTIDGTKNTQL